ncbi:MAG: HAMP domain-containing histidine kinase [Methanospirillaceae archaeon]|nr:HAMP domain-containing histidine kinase [Methanospirillaceae archaeon]
MDTKRRSLARKLMIALTISFVFIICTLSFSSFYLAEKQISSIEQEYINKITDDIKTSIIICQRGLELYDASYDTYLLEVLSVFKESYTNEKRRGSLPNLSYVESTIRDFPDGNVSLYLIDTKGVVVDTTFPPDMGLDFSKYPKFYHTLTEIREADEYRFDPWEESLVDPSRRLKYGYMPTPDHKYILEAGIESDNIREEREKLFSMRSILQREVERDPDIVMISLYNNMGNLLTQVVQQNASILYDIPESYQQELCSFVIEKNQEITREYQNNFLVYAFAIPYINTTAASEGYFDKVGIITYDIRATREQHLILFLIALVITILAVVVTVAVTYYISQRMILPIEKMIDDIEVIATGDYTHRIQAATGRETRRLQQSINSMIATIQQNIQDISRQKEQLDRELQKRVLAEDELKAVNDKLHHLSDLTRHDILNQLTALVSYIDLGREEDEVVPIHEYLDAMHKIGLTIQELIEFTRNYQMMGIRGWTWQDPKRIFDQIFSTIDPDRRFTISSDLGGYLIYADPLLEKALYNLVENSFRHGGPGLTTISVSTMMNDTSLSIIYTDNGTGIPDDDKERIFQRGYGKNTGLGLFMIREILSMTGITISENGTCLKGVRFIIRVPPDSFKKQEKI